MNYKQEDRFFFELSTFEELYHTPNIYLTTEMSFLLWISVLLHIIECHSESTLLVKTLFSLTLLFKWLPRKKVKLDMVGLFLG